ncbi:MAG: CoA-binding protein [Rhodopirellula sp.]|nr:CoA-binding protein [Rhodopirellula sp.]
MSLQGSVSKLDAVFYPQSIAVVGASTRPGTVGNDIFRNLLFSEFQGSVYPINPKSSHVMGVHSYPALGDVPGPIDLAVVIVPAKAVLDVVDQAVEKGVKGLVVISAGFKECGGEGLELENRLRERVQAAGVPLIGPNCLGVINTDPQVTMNAAFGRKMPSAGNLAFLSQSGALCTSVLDYAEERQMGFSKFISFGNKADVNEVDLLEYLADDPKTSVIAMYLEDISNGRQFIETVRKIFWITRKPMLCLKSGRSPEGAKAVSSHTGSLAGSDSVYDALLIQSGVQRVDTIAELFDYAALYTTQPLPRGGRVAIITNAGGPGIMATDAAVRHGMKLAELSDATKSKLRGSLPATASLRNPVDVIGDARSDRYKAAVRTVLEDENVDMGIVILTPQSMTDIEETAAVVPDAIQGIDKPVVCSFMGAKDVAPGVAVLRKAGVPNYPFPEDGVRALAAADRLIRLQEIPRREVLDFQDVDLERANRIVAEVLNDHQQRYLTQAEARPLLECYRLPLLKSAVVTGEDEAARAADAFDGPVVMKVMSADVVHKYDAGGVLLNIHGAEEARAAYAKIHRNVLKAVPEAKIDGILIEQMAGKGVEVILGASRDPRFGPLMMFGLGGTLVEVLKDVSFRLAPMWQISAERMVRQIRSFEVLDGFRGNPPSDVDAIVDTLLRLSAMVYNHPEISELDINPLIVHAKGQGCSVADSRVMLRR